MRMGRNIYFHEKQGFCTVIYSNTLFYFPEEYLKNPTKTLKYALVIEIILLDI